MIRESGIYKIENLVNHKIYIGQSKNIHNRMLQHKNELKHRKHINTHLQKAVDKYGLDNFIFEVIEKCPISLLDEKEVYWIEKLKSADRQYGYNSSLGGQAHRLVSDSTRKLMRENFEGEKSNTAKISETTAKLIIQMLLDGKSIHGVANELKISHKIVEGIRTKKKWKYLTVGVEFPIKRSTKYKWVSLVPNTTYPLYRAIVKVDGKKVSKEEFMSELDKNPEAAEAFAGEQVFYEVSAVGENITYQWQYSKDGGKSWKNATEASADTPCLTVNVKEEKDGRYYRCRVKTKSGSVYSKKAELTVKTSE
jgi:group I intron endonuclease